MSIMFIGGRGAPPILTFIGRTANTANDDPYTFASHAIGSAASDRIVVVLVECESSATQEISSVTIGGNAATLAAKSPSGVQDYNQVGIFYLLVTTGTTADIVVDLTGAPRSCSVSIYTITGLASATPTDAQAASGGSSDPSVTLNIEADGVAIMGAMTSNNSATCTGVGITTEDVDIAQESGRSVSYHDSFPAAQSALTVTANFTANSNSRIVAASWR